MNLTHPYATPKPKSYVGVSLVIALHLAGIYALSAGLVTPTAKPPAITTLKPLPPDIDREPPPPEPLPVNKPMLKDVPVVQVPLPIIDIAPPQEAPLISSVAAPKEPASVLTQPGSTQVAAPPIAVATPQVQAPGAVCSTMPRPEVPAVNWSGEAVLQVVATVRAGRVVGSEFRAVQGVMDGKTRRALQRSVESALAGYQCQGDAVFQQDFAFRLD
jgi:hypothetical protein